MSGWNSSVNEQNVVEKSRQRQAQKPPMYNVLLLNDDYTPMDFVVDVLQRFFNMDTEQANQVMLTVHYKGKARCGTYTADVAETKVDIVSRYALENQHPLKCVMEKA